MAYGAAVLVLATALVFAIMWSVERLAAKDGRRGHARPTGLIRWLGRDCADEARRSRNWLMLSGELNRAPLNHRPRPSRPGRCLDGGIWENAADAVLCLECAGHANVLVRAFG
jgi:hypothetical protein